MVANFVMSMPESGARKGKAYQEATNSLEWDHLALVLPELKGHAALTKEDRLKEL
jgi:hypothetical protein